MKLHLNRGNFEKLVEEDIEVFLCRERPILGWNGEPHPNPKVYTN